VAIPADGAPITEGGRRLRNLLAVTADASPPVRAKALAIRRAAGDQRGIAIALHGLGPRHFRLHELDALRACFEDTPAIGRELEDDRLVAASLTTSATWC